jgi:hypothetical protein
MKDDAIVEEARQAGQRYIDSLHGDWKAIAADLDRRAKKEGRRVLGSLAKSRRAGASKSRPRRSRRAG